MRRPRVYRIGIAEPIYHTMTRAVDGKWIFGTEEEKGVFRGFLEDQCQFSDLELLTYCCMSNHVHLLLRVPMRLHCFDLSGE